MNNPITTEEVTSYLDQILSARARLERVKAACAELIREAEADVAEAELVLPALEMWAKANPPKRGKTIRLPVGQLGWRRVPGGPRVIDDAAALAWARQALPQAVRVEESVDRHTIRAYVERTGELPPGVEIKPDEERFGVRG